MGDRARSTLSRPWLPCQPGLHLAPGLWHQPLALCRCEGPPDPTEPEEQPPPGLVLQTKPGPKQPVWLLQALLQGSRAGGACDSSSRGLGSFWSAPSAEPRWQRARCSNALGSIWERDGGLGCPGEPQCRGMGRISKPGWRSAAHPSLPSWLQSLPIFPGLPGNINTRASVVNPPGIVCFKRAGSAVPSPGERQPLRCLGTGRSSCLVHRGGLVQVGGSARTPVRGFGSLQDPL